jgi:hypothetical protein
MTREDELRIECDRLLDSLEIVTTERDAARAQIAAALAICDLYDMPTMPRNVSAAGRVIRRALTGETP